MDGVPLYRARTLSEASTLMFNSAHAKFEVSTICSNPEAAWTACLEREMGGEMNLALAENR